MKFSRRPILFSLIIGMGCSVVPIASAQSPQEQALEKLYRTCQVIKKAGDRIPDGAEINGLEVDEELRQTCQGVQPPRDQARQEAPEPSERNEQTPQAGGSCRADRDKASEICRQQLDLPSLKQRMSESQSGSASLTETANQMRSVNDEMAQIAAKAGGVCLTAAHTCKTSCKNDSTDPQAQSHKRQCAGFIADIYRMRAQAKASIEGSKHAENSAKHGEAQERSHEGERSPHIGPHTPSGSSEGVVNDRTRYAESTGNPINNSTPVAQNDNESANSKGSSGATQAGGTGTPSVPQPKGSVKLSPSGDAATKEPHEEMREKMRYSGEREPTSGGSTARIQANESNVGTKSKDEAEADNQKTMQPASKTASQGGGKTNSGGSTDAAGPVKPKLLTPEAIAMTTAVASAQMAANRNPQQRAGIEKPEAQQPAQNQNPNSANSAAGAQKPGEENLAWSAAPSARAEVDRPNFAAATAPMNSTSGFRSGSMRLPASSGSGGGGSARVGRFETTLPGRASLENREQEPQDSQYKMIQVGNPNAAGGFSNKRKTQKPAYQLADFLPNGSQYQNGHSPSGMDSQKVEIQTRAKDIWQLVSERFKIRCAQERLMDCRTHLPRD